MNQTFGHISASDTKSNTDAYKKKNAIYLSSMAAFVF